MPLTNKTYDLRAIKAVPILQVAAKLGIILVKTGQDTYQEKDSNTKEKVTSLTIFTKTNSFVRFSGKEYGGCSKGSVIDFVCHVTDNAHFVTACKFLAQLL